MQDANTNRRASRFGMTTAWLMGACLCLCPAAVRSESPSSPASRAPDVVYVGSPHDVIAEMLDAAQLTGDDVVYDLGCGDGRIVIDAAKFHGAKGVGYELVPELVEIGRVNAAANGVDHLVTIEQRDIFTVDLSPASVIMLYMHPDVVKALIPQFAALAPGSRIITHDAPMEGVEPDATYTVHSREDGVNHFLRVFTTPLTLESTTATSESGPTTPPAISP
ncbi:methyltransferase domain-containing protein [Myxococcota bacterium]|nr:methyltransferase domain-containing protein [Myxococcota bacterium]